MEQGGFRIDALLRVNNHSQRLARGWYEANGELRIVAVHGFYTDQDGVTITSQFVDLLETASRCESLSCF